jgi:hypothetical protein
MKSVKTDRELKKNITTNRIIPRKGAFSPLKPLTLQQRGIKKHENCKLPEKRYARILQRN